MTTSAKPGKKKTDDSFYTHYTNFIPATPQPINLEINELNSIFFLIPDYVIKTIAKMKWT